MKMQAALWYGPEEIKIEEVDIPSIGTGEVLVKVTCALTCGTDFKLFRGGHALLVKNIPSPFGHEMAGTITKVGSHVNGFREGDRVVAANSAPCDACPFCREERWNLCENLEFLSGAYAEYIRIPKRIVQKNLYKIPDGLSFRESALTEPLACAVHCMEKVSPRPGEPLVVIGAGTCGLFFTQLGKLRGSRVFVVGRGEDKLKVAKSLGAEETFSVIEGDVRERVKEATGGGPQWVLEAAGQPETWELAVDLVRKGGHVWFYGGCTKGSRVSLDTHRLHYDEITCSGVFHHTPIHFAQALNLLAEKKIDPSHLIVGERPLKNLNQVFQKGMKENPLKIVILP